MSLADRILGSFDRLASSAPAREGLPDARYLACWSYSVTSANETTFSGRALSKRNPQPDLPNIPNMPGPPGTLLQPAAGSIVSVVFVDADPAQPRVVSWDQNAAVVVKLRAATIPSAPATTLEVGASQVQVYAEPHTVPAQAVALAPAVTSFANAVVTFGTAMAVGWTAVATFGTAAGVAVPALAAAGGTLATAATTAAAASTALASAVGALVGTFPTGITATKLKTQ